MQCKNQFCIYQSNGSCLLDAVELDISGLCTSCIYPDIDEVVLTKAKQELLAKYESEAADNL